MRMDIPLQENVSLEGLQAGDRVRFDLARHADGFHIEALRKDGSGEQRP